MATDGLAEAVGADGAPFGYERIARELGEVTGRTAPEVVEALFDILTDFLEGKLPQDDVTHVAMDAR